MLTKPSKPRPELDELLKRANTLTPEQQREHRAAQRKSWFIGEMMLAHPEITREEAARRYDEVLDRGDSSL